jgi:hypothetical protein
MRRFVFATLAISASVALGGCGGSTSSASINAASVTCAQINADTNGVVEKLGRQLARQIHGGSETNGNVIAGSISGDLSSVCLGTTGQPNGSANPAHAALALYEQQHGGASSTTTTSATTAPATTSTAAAASTSASKEATVLHALLKLAGYIVTPVTQSAGTSGATGVPGSAIAANSGFMATSGGHTVFVAVFDSMQEADGTAAGLAKGAAKGTGAYKQIGPVIVFALAAGASVPTAAVNSAAAVIEGKK